MSSGCALGSGGALSTTPSPEQISSSLIKAQRFGSSHDVDELPQAAEELLFPEVRSRFGGPEPNVDVWSGLGLSFSSMSIGREEA